MAKGTTVFIFILAVLATLLLGINIGKKIKQSEIFNLQNRPSPILTPTIFPPTLSPSPSPVLLEFNDDNSITSSQKKVKGISTYTNDTCGFSFSYPGSYMNTKTINSESKIFSDPDNPNEAIATTCAAKIPRPPVASEQIDSIVLDNQPATLYHDKNPDGSLRDEVIVKHPTRNIEIIIAGYGPTFQQTLSSFKFLK